MSTGPSRRTVLAAASLGLRGRGMVRFPEFFAMVKRSGFNGPVQMHFEYPLSGAPEEVYGAMKRDLTQLRGYLEKAGL